MTHMQVSLVPPAVVIEPALPLLITPALHHTVVSISVHLGHYVTECDNVRLKHLSIPPWQELVLSVEMVCWCGGLIDPLTPTITHTLSVTTVSVSCNVCIDKLAFTCNLFVHYD